MDEIVDGLFAITVHIRDIQKSRRFYREVLGLKELRFDEKGSSAAYALPGTRTLLSMHIQGPGEGGREPGTPSGAVFHVSDVARACDEIRRRGGTITLEPTAVETPAGKFHRAAVADPDGNEFLISDRKG